MDNIYTAAEPFMKLGKFFGHFPLNFDGPARKGFFKTKWQGVVCSFVIASILITLNVLNSLKRTTVMSKSLIITNGWLIAADIVFYSQLALLAYQIYRRNFVATFLKQIHDIDEAVRTF